MSRLLILVQERKAGNQADSASEVRDGGAGEREKSGTESTMHGGVYLLYLLYR